jgi:hypothetical protein
MHSIKMKLNTLYIFVHSKSIFIKRYYKLHCKFIKLQYTLKYFTLRETVKNSVQTTWLLLAGAAMESRYSERGSTVQGTASVLCYRNLHCDRNLVFENSKQTEFRHTHTLTYLVGHFWISDQLVSQAATHTTHNIHNRRISMFEGGFEPAISDIKELHATL